VVSLMSISNAEKMNALEMCGDLFFFMEKFVRKNVNYFTRFKVELLPCILY
jgi:hypothetical protein